MVQELILSVLESHPSARDSRFYLKNFGPSSLSSKSSSSAATPAAATSILPPTSTSIRTTTDLNTSAFPISETPTPTTAFVPATVGGHTLDFDALSSNAGELTEEVLQINLHTALVKIQGPFTDRQLESIAEGMVYLKRLGLVSIIVMDNEEWDLAREIIQGESKQERESRIILLREEMKRDTLKFADMLEAKGGEARPLLEGVLCVEGATFRKTWTPIPSASTTTTTSPLDSFQPNATTSSELFVDSLSGIRDAIRRGEIPIIPPIALNASCFSLCVSANDAVRAISSGLADHERNSGLKYDSEKRLRNDVDLTPVRIMIINREGGIPSPARGGNPHLSINLSSEYDYIRSTFIWSDSHPTALSNLSLLRSCLADLPRTASAVIVSHRSPKSLIANLITNKPAHSPSLHYSLLRDDYLQFNPTIVRRGRAVRIFRSLDEMDLPALTRLLESSFGRELKVEEYYTRLARDVEFVIVAGDYEGVAIVTSESSSSPSSSDTPIAYLDKFAVLPSLQGDGTVDFLWGALRDESFALGLLDALNPNVGGRQGLGTARDLVWRSRERNPVNKWYFERSNGFLKIPSPPPSPSASSSLVEVGEGGGGGGGGGFCLFWCEAEQKPGSKAEEGNRRTDVSMLRKWSDVISQIPSCWV